MDSFPTQPIPPTRRTYTLSDFDPNARVATPGTTTVVNTGDKTAVVHKKRGINIWLIWLVLAIVIGVILYFSHPSIVLSRNATTNELYVDWGKLILWAIGISLVVVLLLWLLKGAIGYEMNY
jgi:hypothetical protein